MSIENKLNNSKDRDFIYGANIVGAFIPLASKYVNPFTCAGTLLNKYVVKDNDWKTALYAGLLIGSAMDTLSGIDIKSNFNDNFNMILETGVDVLVTFSIYKEMLKYSGKNLVSNTLDSFKNLHDRYRGK